MPLIKHSPEFIAKREAKLREASEAERNKEKEQRANTYLDYMEYLQELDRLIIPNSKSFEPSVKVLDHARVQEILAELLHARISFQKIFLLGECKILFELMREVRINKELCKKIYGKYPRDPEVFVKTEELMNKVRYNLFIIQEFEDLGPTAFVAKYKKQPKKRKEIIKASESNETREHREKRIQEYIRSLNFNEGNSNESL